MSKTAKTTGGFLGVILLGGAGILWLPSEAPKFNGVIEYVESDGVTKGKDTFLDLTLEECIIRIDDGALNIAKDGGRVVSSDCLPEG